MVGLVIEKPDDLKKKVEKIAKECFSTSTEEVFDAVHQPSHYTEGRKYEPRKVIADWGLNFNLGNAVKYLSRAGRKGDKIENLRKAIQYIEFEIDECSKHSEYEELLNSLKNRPMEELVKIVEQLKLELNKKYGAEG